MARYRLMVIGLHGGAYGVNFAHDGTSTILRNMPQVIDYITELDRTVLAEEPNYVSLMQEDEEIFESVRKGILKRENLTSKL